MNFVTRTTLRGLSVVLPLALSIYLIVWLVRSSENLLRSVVTSMIPGHYYFPGLGLISLLIIVFLTGLLMYPWITRGLIDKVDRVFRSIPILSTVYGPIKDLFTFFGGEEMSQKLGQPVMFKLPNCEVETLGFITRKELEDLPESMRKEESVLVYVQMSMQLGGFTFLVPKSAIRPVEISSEEGLRFVLTAGLSAPKEKKNK